MVEERGTDIIQMSEQREKAAPKLVVPHLPGTREGSEGYGLDMERTEGSLPGQGGKGQGRGDQGAGEEETLFSH